MQKVGLQTSLNKEIWQGLSNEVKPILGINETDSRFYCLDTGEEYIWHVDQWYLKVDNGGSGLGKSEKLFVMTGGVTLTNSTVETSMLDGGIGSNIIPANTLKIGDILEFYWFSRLTCGTSQQSYVRIKIGGVTLKEHLATLPNNLNANMFEGTVKIVILSEGVGGTCRISGSSEVLQNNLTGLKRDLGNTDIKPINTTIDNVFDFTYQWFTASIGNINTSYASNLLKI